VSGARSRKGDRCARLLRPSAAARRAVCTPLARPAAIARSAHIDEAILDRELARAVAAHKSCFFPEKDATGAWIDYRVTTGGAVQIVPVGRAREALQSDYAAMVSDEVMLGSAMPFDELLQVCAALQDRANQAAA
jgi:hypothetical protein